MNSTTRRRFLQLSGVGAAAAVLSGATVIGWRDLVARSESDPLPGNAKVLVLVTLYGGNDGLNTVVPAADPAYQNARPHLSYQPHEVLPLADGLGLNPGMPGFKKLWDDKKLAVVRGVSYPKPDHSHFRSMAIWQTAAPGSPLPTGWLGRWLDNSGADPLLAVAMDAVLPPMLVGARTAGATLPIAGLTLPAGALGAAFQQLGAPQPGESTAQAEAARSITDLHRAASTLGGAVDPARRGKAAGPNGGALGAQLDVVARCVEIGVPTRVYSVSIGGFDTHADERGTQQRALTEVDGAVSAFLRRMAGTERGRQVVVGVYSEFGRRVAANASQGTDHGTAGPMFLAGHQVIGGFHGDEPSLTDLDNGDLKSTVDFRDVYATMLEQVLHTDSATVLGERRKPLTLIA